MPQTTHLLCWFFQIFFLIKQSGGKNMKVTYYNGLWPSKRNSYAYFSHLWCLVAIDVIFYHFLHNTSIEAHSSLFFSSISLDEFNCSIFVNFCRRSLADNILFILNRLSLFLLSSFFWTSIYSNLCCQTTNSSLWLTWHNSAELLHYIFTLSHSLSFSTIYTYISITLEIV